MRHRTDNQLPSFEVGSDVGGTFTDLWVRASDGRERVFKSATTPDLVDGLVAVLELAAMAFELPVEAFCQRVTRFGHGTTVGLNALLTGETAKTAVITTQGFGDTLEIGRMKRQYTGLAETEVSDYLKRDRVPAIVGRRLVAEVPERVDRTGSVILPLDELRTREVVASLIADRVQAVAICTLWSTENPAHELRIRELIAESAGDVEVSVSHEVAPTVGEYARMSTTAANAALKPVVSAYVGRLQHALSQLGVGVPVLMTTGSGGVVPTGHTAGRPIAALLSGPVAGVIACQALGRRMGRDRILTTDVGGTSFDVGLIVDGDPLVASQFSFGGVDIHLPCIDVRSIGAGGGSIASVEFGELTVGPRSAGSVPGPACYGRGGALPTATDADLVLGVLSSGDFAPDGRPLDRDAAELAISSEVAAPLGLGVIEAAWGIRQVLDSRMADLLRKVTIERGHDPRTFAMFAAGGSGPSHAWVLSRELGTSEFVIPSTATVQSAVGTATSDIKVSAERALHVRITGDGAVDEQQLAELRAACGDTVAEVLDAPAIDAATGAPELRHTISVRYRGQSQHLDIRTDPAEFDAGRLGTVLERFENEYELLFGQGAGFRPAGFEILGIRSVATRHLDGHWPPAPGEALELIGTREVWFDDPATPVQTRVYQVGHPARDQVVDGPCLIKYPGQTAVVPPGSTAHTDELGNLIVRST